MLTIAKPLRYVFYRILTWKLRDSREALLVLTAAGIMLVLLDANLLAPYLLFSHLTGRTTRWLSEWPGIGRGGAYILAGVITLGFAHLIAYLWEVPQIDLRDDGLHWYRYDESRKDTLIPIEELPQAILCRAMPSCM
jgi:hypothetical protein